MTFIEAAADILNREGRPLHAKDIAEMAVKAGILSHVGKTPVQTMSAQLSAAVLKGTGPFLRVRPGVFALEKWKGKPPGPQKKEKDADTASSPTQKKARESHEKIRAAAVAPKTEKAPAQGAAEAEDAASSDAGAAKRRKRRRKKTSKPKDSPSPEVTAESVSGAEPKALSESDGVKTVQPSVEKHKSPSASKHPTQEMADLAEKALRQVSHPLPAEKIFDEIGTASHNGAMLLEALLVSDSFERERAGQMPRFVKHKSGWALLAREVSGEIVALEHQAAEIRKRMIQLAERQVLKRLRALPLQGFVRAMIVFLEQAGFGAVKPAGHKSLDGFSLSVEDRRRNGRFRTAVILRQTPSEHVLSERAVMDLRGAMHHFDAMNGMILTTGQVSEKAIQEGRIPNLPPVAAVDGEALAKEMVQLGVGIKKRTVSLPVYDDAFFGKIEF